MKRRLLATLYCATLGLALSGCGQKGALYLPEKAQTVVRSTTPAPSTPAAAPATAPTSKLAPGETPPDAPPDRAPPNTTDPDKDKVSPKPPQ